MKRILLFVALAVGASVGRADVTLPVVFTENMVLQRDQPIRIWGEAAPGEAVSIKLADRAVNATADGDGKWKAELAALPAGGPHTLTIAGKNSLSFTNVLLGDVWVVGGSWGMMNYQLGWAANGEYEIARAGDHPLIRVFQFTPREVPWQVSSPTAVSQFSAIGYMFGRRLHLETGVPIGLIQAALDTRVVSWMSPEGLRASPELKLPAATWERGMGRFDRRLSQFVTEAEAWEKAGAAARQAGAPEPPPPSVPQDPRTNIDDGSIYPAAAYSSSIARLVPYGIRGVIWMSGGTCGRDGQDTLYRYALSDLIRDWRRLWGNEKLPFLFTDLYAPVPGWYERTALVVEEQLKILQQLPNTSIVPIDDLIFAEGDSNEPELARRFALQALALAYGRKTGGFGPGFSSLSADHGKLLVRLTNARGLRSAFGRPLHGFEIAGTNAMFTSANVAVGADAAGTYVQVWNDAVPNPAMMRYGWSYSPQPANLVNRDGIPAVPFRAAIGAGAK